MTPEQIKSGLKTLNGWEIIKLENIARLTKVYHFKNFAEALAFTNQVGALAEQKNHHPSILTEWGKVTLSWWTHTAQGLTQADFDMAAKVDKLG